MTIIGDSFFFNLFLFLVVLGLLCFVQVSLVAAGWGCCSSLCMGFSLLWLLLLQSMGSVVGSVVSACGLESMGSVVVAARLSRSMAYGILLDQGLNLRILHWQADSYLLHHQGNPIISVP